LASATFPARLSGTKEGSSHLAFRELRMGRRKKWRNRRLLLRGPDGPVILGNDWGRASIARRNRNLK
jgi:hypothetical protein